MKKLLFLLFLSLYSFTWSQKNGISKSVKKNYYSKEIEVGVVNKSLYDTLGKNNAAHPVTFYESCARFYEAKMMNEAAICFLVATQRYKLYNLTNPDYEASGDGALAGSFKSIIGEFMIPYLNKNLNNYQKLLKKTREWYEANEYDYFDNVNHKKYYYEQIQGLKDFESKLKLNPEEYILSVEKQREMLNALNEELINEEELIEIESEIEVEEEVVIDTTRPLKNPTSNVPGSFIYILDSDKKLHLDIENKFMAVAHGYYDTKVTVDNGQLIQDTLNPLNYVVIPNKIGICKITIFGMSEKGRQVCLGQYSYEVIKP